MADRAAPADQFAIEIFDYVGQTIAQSSTTFLDPVLDRWIDLLQSTTISAVTLYIACIALRNGFGYSSRPTSETLVAVGKIVVVTLLIGSADTFGTYVIDMFRGIEGSFAQAFGVEAGTAGTYAVLDAAFSRGMDAASLCFLMSDESGTFEFGKAFGWNLAGLVVALGTGALTTFAAGAIIMARFALALLFAVGPLFVLAAAFPITRRFFELWTASVLEATLVIVFVGATSTLASAAFVALVIRSDFSGEMHPMIVAIMLFALACLLTYLIYRVGKYAAGLSGGMSSAAFTLGQAAHGVATGHGAIRTLANPHVTRRDVASNRLVRAPLSEHLRAGNTWANKNYRAAAVANAGRGWRSTGGAVTQAMPSPAPTGGNAHRAGAAS